MTGDGATDDWRMESGLAARARQHIRTHRRGALWRTLATVAEKYLRAWYNEGFYEFDANGERFALEAFADWWGPRPMTVWDVGANDGQWATLAHAIFGAAHVHSFEIVPPIADRFAANMADAEWSTLHRIGLSNAVGETTVTWNRACDTTSAIAIRNSGVPGGDYQTMVCEVSTIDDEIASGLPPPDFLKIDTEGHDPAVLAGGLALLASSQPPLMIQFEYGETWLPSQGSLAQTQAQLEKHGYRVGRLYPNHVAFKAYAYRDDHYRMGNMIAVRTGGRANGRETDTLVRRLAGG